MIDFWRVNERVYDAQVEPLLIAAGSLAGGISHPNTWRRLAQPEDRRSIVDINHPSKAKYIKPPDVLKQS